MTPDSRGVRYAVIAILLGILVIMFVTRISQTAEVTNQIRESQVTNAQTLDQSRQLLHAIQDCTQPQGKCYQRSQRQTAGAVANINRVIIVAAACATGVTPDLPVRARQSVIQQCVINRLALDKPS
jgi:hypothetical protein